ncbi:GntR family transcriptional regulator [Conyzicola nivalis]|uniref:GntR family transcriptional regulator n=1 Tax=Conyzicola nivalis TaxID=1477021 RepID=A0A916SKH1_9MICO|nr:GntR family transcriptional regulator [Conyzicola nivalis]GGB04507.1 GntR family transcriptional regulator [Conyzicola nivalis]
MADVMYKQIADDLRSAIQTGRLRPGDDVPSESELAERWNTSRGPIRNAFAALRAEGLIETTRGRPGRVIERKVHQAVDVSIPFTKWALDIGAKPGAVTQHVSLRRSDSEQAALLGIAEGDQVVEVLRLRSLDDRPTMVERLTYIEPVGRNLFDVDLDAVSITQFLESRGWMSAEVDHEIDAVAADETDASLLGLAPGAPILRLRRITRHTDGRTIEASDDRYRSDIVRFTVSASGRHPEGDHFIRPLGR